MIEEMVTLEIGDVLGDAPQADYDRLHEMAARRSGWKPGWPKRSYTKTEGGRRIYVTEVEVPRSVIGAADE